MDFDLKKEQETLQTAATRFAQNALRDTLAEGNPEFPRDAWRRCTDYGLQAMPLPYEYGGGGHDLMTIMAVMEGFAYGCADSRLVFAVNNHLWRACLPVFFCGSEDQKREYMPRLCRGALIGTSAWREQGAGVDVSDVRMVAVEDGESFVLSGVKEMVCGGEAADLFVVYVRTMRDEDDEADEDGSDEVTAFLVPRATRGLSVEADFGGQGGRVPYAAKVVFDGCRLTRDDMLGPAGRGEQVFRCSMEWEYGCCLAACLGLMAGQVDRCYARARGIRGSASAMSADDEVVRRIVQMRVRQEAARPMVYRVGWVKQKNRYAHTEAHAARLFVADAFLRNAQAEAAILGDAAMIRRFASEARFIETVGGLMHAVGESAGIRYVAESICLI